MFKITSGKGFHIQFQNKWIVSCQFGYENYCDNYNIHDMLDVAFSSTPYNDISCANCEIMIWNKNGQSPLLSECDTVEGHITPDQLSQIFDVIRELPEDYFDERMLLTCSAFQQILKEKNEERYNVS